MPEFCLRIDESKEVVNKQTVRDVFAELKAGRYRVRIEKANKRSGSQNAFYWLLLTDYIQPGLYDLGYREIKRKEDAHAFCSNEFLKRPVINELTGEVKYHVRSTSELTTIEWEEYREDLNQFASEYLGITLPDPNEQLTITY